MISVIKHTEDFILHVESCSQVNLYGWYIRRARDANTHLYNYQNLEKVFSSFLLPKNLKIKIKL